MTVRKREIFHEATPDWFYFDIHNLVRMRITASHPSAYSIVKSFGPFQVAELERWDLTLVKEITLEEQHSFGTTMYEFSPTCAVIKSRNVSVALRDEGILLGGSRDLLPYVMPLIHWKMLEHKATMIHGASVAVDGQGILMPAWGGTGKTSAMVQLVKLQNTAFMGDDFTIVCSDGMLLSYPKPFFIYPYHRNIFPHLFKNKPKLLVPSWLSRPMALVREAVRPTVAAFPRLESFCRRFTPEHMQVAAHKALPDVEFADNAPLKLILFLERYNGSEPIVDQLDPIIARRRVVGNHYFELGVHAQELMTACSATGLLGLEEWFGRMSEVVDEVFGRLPIYRLRLPPMKLEPAGKAIAAAAREQLAKL